jgi:hypothetical protein
MLFLGSLAPALKDQGMQYSTAAAQEDLGYDDLERIEEERNV